MKEIFSNKSLNKLHMHYGFIRFAENISTTFGIIILYKMGYELYQVFIIFGLMHFLRIIVRIIIPYYIKKYSLKNIVIFGTGIYTILLPSFYLFTENIIPLWIYILVFSITTSFYWYPFHTLYGIIGDSEKRGKQSAIRETYYRIAQVLSPLFSGTILEYFGTFWLFIFGTFIFILALLSLLKVKGNINPEISLDWKSNIKKSSKYPFFISFYFAFWRMFFDYAWVLVLFLLFNENTKELGGIISIALIFRTIIDYYVGHNIDMKKKFRWYYLGGFIISLTILARVFYGFNIETIIVLNLFLMLGYSLFTPYESVLLYNSIKDSKYPEWVSLIGEAGRDLGTMISCLILAVLSYNGFELRYIMPIGIISIGLSVILYNRYFYSIR